LSRLAAARASLGAGNSLPDGIAYQGLGRRFAAFFVDVALLYVLLFAWEGIFGEPSPAVAVLLLSAFFNYFVVTEWRFERTLGKRLLLIRVVSEDGSSLRYNAAAIRNVALVVDFLPFGFIVGVLFIAESSRKQRLGDRWAKTVVLGPSGPALGNPPPPKRKELGL